ncbi:sterol desaturase family protein [Croceibacterium xixiisoli]|nr:sterol desaturase family protein [Croceibacterium xixiisoli]
MGVAACATVMIVWLRYLLVSGFFAFVTRRKRPGLYDRMAVQIRMEIMWSTLSAVIYGLPAGVVLWLWASGTGSAIYLDAAEYPWWWLVAAPIVYLLIHDAWFYWSHRLMHVPAVYRACHYVHHRSHPPTAWAAMSFHWTEALSGAWLIPVLALFIPIHVGALGFVMAVMTLFGVTNHMGWEIWPRWMVHGRLGGLIITATHHDNHHRKNKGNYGLYFRFWDRLCGTDVGFSRFGADRPDRRRHEGRGTGPGTSGHVAVDDNDRRAAQ